MVRSLSMITPNSDVHLGNYLGALVHWAEDQDNNDCFFGMSDLHALTNEIDPATLRAKTLEVAMILMATGLDPERCTLFCQSHVVGHTQLAWIMENNLSYGELSRMTQFKAKAETRDYVPAGLFTYPALMAADIIIYDADEVPVGEDQRQHVEVARDAAIRFNNRFGEDTLTVPKAVIPKVGARVMDLQEPTKKMSKSASSPQGKIDVLDTPAQMAKKIKRAVTDADNEVRYDRQAKPGVSNLLELLAAVTGGDPVELAGNYTQYGPLKSDTADAVVAYMAPFHQRYAELSADPAQVHAALRRGADKAGQVATTTVDRAYRAVGLLMPE